MKKVNIYTFVLTLYMFNIDKQEKGYSLKMASIFGRAYSIFRNAQTFTFMLVIMSLITSFNKSLILWNTSWSPSQQYTRYISPGQFKSGERGGYILLGDMIMKRF